MVNTHVPVGAMFPQLVGVMVVPSGNAGDGVYVTLLAVVNGSLNPPENGAALD